MDLMQDIETFLKVGAGILGVLAIYMPFGVIFFFLLSLRSIRVRRGDGIVRLTGFDAWPMMWSGFVFCGACALSVVWGWKVALLTASASVVLALGFRLRVRVSAEGTRIIRSFAYVIPWSWRACSEVPTAYVDGWGDFSDPEALYLGFEGQGSSIELGWGDRWSGDRCDTLATAFNEAVREEIFGGDGGLRGANDVSDEGDAVSGASNAVSGASNAVSGESWVP